MELKRLTIGDKQLFEDFLALRSHELSAYAFPAVYGWKGLFDIRWARVNSSLCIFFGDATGWFLYLPPLGKKLDARAVEECFREMEGRNKNPAVSRIENAEENDLPAFRELGYPAAPKAGDYVYGRAALAALAGDRFKSKRAMVNNFERNNSFECVPYSAAHREQCLALYRAWMAERASSKRGDSLYCGMLSDSLNCLETVLEEAGRLGMLGQVILSDGRCVAFTLGYRLNAETLCILFEVADRSAKGAGQFIFRSFCRENGEFLLVNAMDDSGLENLGKVKQSYRPLKMANAYIINRKDGGE
jgi:uncharacterized protein